ncbi:hypothetical protein CMV_027177, partial [Castanea mollissima]
GKFLSQSPEACLVLGGILSWDCWLLCLCSGAPLSSRQCCILGTRQVVGSLLEG